MNSYPPITDIKMPPFSAEKGGSAEGMCLQVIGDHLQSTNKGKVLAASVSAPA